MSAWTYVDGTVTVSPDGLGQHAKTFVLNEVLDHLPKVWGSEGDMSWTVVMRDGYRSSCNHDEFGIRSNLSERGWWTEQDTYVILLHGSLRDTFFEDTLRSFTRWLCRLSKRVVIEDVLVRVSGNAKHPTCREDWHKSHLFNGAGYLSKNYWAAKDAKKAEGIGTRISNDWRYGIMPERAFWPDVLVNLVPGGNRLAMDYDFLNGNLEHEEFLEYRDDINILKAIREGETDIYDGVLGHYAELIDEHRSRIENVVNEVLRYEMQKLGRTLRERILHG